jgi:hypothetical protein
MMIQNRYFSLIMLESVTLMELDSLTRKESIIIFLNSLYS